MFYIYKKYRIFYIKPITKQLEINVLIHLKNLCKLALEKYPTTIEEDQIKFKENNEKENNINLR
ncbi:MAG: hypothetical protein HUJ61_03465, partial [Bacilli bacterium]|nr:hypothetical protein [Bacilli bacterium]